jgi:predicted GNAT family acetyltransferase
VPAVTAIFEAREANGRAASLAEKLDMRLGGLIDAHEQAESDRRRREQVLKEMLEEIIERQVETETQRQSDLARIAETGAKRFEELHDQMLSVQNVQHDIRASQAQLASEMEVARREGREAAGRSREIEPHLGMLVRVTVQLAELMQQVANPGANGQDAVVNLEGDDSNVVRLPTPETVRALERFARKIVYPEK